MREGRQGGFNDSERRISSESNFAFAILVIAKIDQRDLPPPVILLANQIDDVSHRRTQKGGTETYMYNFGEIFEGGGVRQVVHHDYAFDGVLSLELPLQDALAIQTGWRVQDEPESFHAKGVRHVWKNGMRSARRERLN